MPCWDHKNPTSVKMPDFFCLLNLYAPMKYLLPGMYESSFVAM